jgi:hypothetical protein
MTDLVLETINTATRFSVIGQQTELQTNNAYTQGYYFRTKQIAAHPKLNCCIYCAR